MTAIQIPQVQYCDAIPLGVASWLAFLASLLFVSFLMTPKIRRIQHGRKVWLLRISGLLERLQVANDKLISDLHKWQGKLCYGPLHQKWEVYYRRALELWHAKRASAKAQREAEVAEVVHDPRLHTIAGRALSKLMGTGGQ